MLVIDASHLPWLGETIRITPSLVATGSSTGPLKATGRTRTRLGYVSARDSRGTRRRVSLRTLINAGRGRPLNTPLTWPRLQRPALQTIRPKTTTERRPSPACYEARKGENMSRPGEQHGLSKLTEHDVRAIRKTEGRSAVIAEAYGVTRQCIDRIRQRLTWAWLTD